MIGLSPELDQRAASLVISNPKSRDFCPLSGISLKSGSRSRFPILGGPGSPGNEASPNSGARDNLGIGDRRPSTGQFGPSDSPFHAVLEIRGAGASRHYREVREDSV